MTCIRCKSVLPGKLKIFAAIILHNYYLNTLVIVTVGRKRCTNEKVLKLQRYSLSFGYYNIAQRVSFFCPKLNKEKLS